MTARETGEAPTGEWPGPRVVVFSYDVSMSSPSRIPSGRAILGRKIVFIGFGVMVLGWMCGLYVMATDMATWPVVIVGAGIALILTGMVMAGRDVNYPHRQ